jgi:hypothetical protein
MKLLKMNTQQNKKPNTIFSGNKFSMPSVHYKNKNSTVETNLMH